MTWLAVILLAAVALAFAVFALRLPRQGWTLFAAVLVFGLAGYTLQGSPELPAAPKSAQAVEQQSGEVIVSARRALFDPDMPPPGFLTLSDGFARRGRYEEAAQLLRNGLAENPDFGEGWLALANALVEHAGGRVTPAALFAFERADQTLDGHPGPAYFRGVAHLRSGEPAEAKEVWSHLLQKSPADAPWREDLAARIEQIDALIAQASAEPTR